MKLKQKPQIKRTPVLVAVVFVVIITVVAFLSFSDVGLAVFDFVFGNNVYALQVTYVPSVDSFGYAKVAFILILQQTRMPAESVLFGYDVRTDAKTSFDDGNFSITLYVQAYIANDVPVYGKTLVFEDGEARTLTCYLQHYSSGRLVVTVGGFTVYNDVRTDFSGYGGQWRN